MSLKVRGFCVLSGTYCFEKAKCLIIRLNDSFGRFLKILKKKPNKTCDFFLKKTDNFITALYRFFGGASLGRI
jgi:hypothetical protein